MSRAWPVLLLLLAGTTHSPAEPSEAWKARSAAAQQLDIGESAPDWLADSETYAFGTGPGDWDALAQSKVAFVTHCPVIRDYFERAHALGVRCFPYVTFYQGFASQTYEDLNLKDHPEFIEVDGEGNLKRTGFWETEDAKNMYTTCPNVQAYQDAMVAWVRKIMELGADGVFVDNLGSRVECFGPKFGKHQHVYEDQNHAFAMLLKRVREVIREYKPDGAVLGNSASPTSLPKEYWKYLDAEMLESYICTWVSTERWMDWTDHWNKVGKDLQPYVRAGKQIQALSYLGHTPYGVREDAFFCYASARLAGFVWNGGGPIGNSETADLYRLRLGKALTGELEDSGVHYRVFEKGLVAVNPDKEKPAAITLDTSVPGRALLDCFGGTAAWAPLETGYAADVAVNHGGKRAIACELSDGTKTSGAVQVVELNQTAPLPITVTGWSKAENVTGSADANYSLYADVQYSDGTWFYGQTAQFSVGTHDWERQSVTIAPEKPIRAVTLNAIFRYKTGKVWFDDVSLLDDQGGGRPKNGGFEELETRGVTVKIGADRRLEIPKYSGRVYLFLPETENGLYTAGPKLTVVTEPGLGEVRFRVDGFDYWTHCGSWTTEYVKGASFGKFDIVFDKPGKHSVEVIDLVPADMKTAKGYGSGEHLGQFMDPSNPTRTSDGKKFKFRQWKDRGDSAAIEVEVNADTELTALFDVIEGKQ